MPHLLHVLSLLGEFFPPSFTLLGLLCRRGFWAGPAVDRAWRGVGSLGIWIFEPLCSSSHNLAGDQKRDALAYVVLRFVEGGNVTLQLVPPAHHRSPFSSARSLIRFLRLTILNTCRSVNNKLGPRALLFAGSLSYSLYVSSYL